MSTNRFVLIGGFLGAGKTTALLRLARWLAHTRQWKVGVITNDQASGLVDTALAQGGGLSVKEIGGGCFCCRSETLMDAIESLTQTVQPQVIIGEPVGSCTDLVATVLGPLRSIYNTSYKLAPLSVVIDPFRAASILDNNRTIQAGFSENVNYIYQKQLEEAELLIVNKCDVYDQKRLSTLCSILRERYGKAEVLTVSARAGLGLEEWWERLLVRTHKPNGFMPVNYQVYADGEAQLGWVNGEYEIGVSPKLKRTFNQAVEINGNRLLEILLDSIIESCRAAKVEIAHMKLSLESTEGSCSDLAVLQWILTDTAPEFTQRLGGSITGGKLLVNLRAEAEPSFLSKAVNQGLSTIRSQVSVKRRKYAAFKPLPPKPTHRITESTANSTETQRSALKRRHAIV